MDNFVSKIIRLKFNQKQKSERSKANQSYSNLFVEKIYITSPSVNLRFLGANKCRIKDEGRPPYTCIYFERRCSTLRCDEAWQIHAVRARASRGSTRFCGLDVVGRDRTRSNELMPRSGRGGEGPLEPTHAQLHFLSPLLFLPLCLCRTSYLRSAVSPPAS